MRIWILWQKQNRKGKTTKIPFPADGEKTRISDNYKHTWVTYNEAVISQSKYHGASTGFNLSDGYLFRDIDYVNLKQLLSAENDYAMNVNQFFGLVKKFTEVQEITAEIIREFIEKIYVYQAEKIDGHRVQKIKVIWNYIGQLPSTNSEA